MDRSYQSHGRLVKSVASRTNVLGRAQQAQTLLAFLWGDLVDIFSVFRAKVLGRKPHAIAETDHDGGCDGCNWSTQPSDSEGLASRLEGWMYKFASHG